MNASPEQVAHRHVLVRQSNTVAHTAERVQPAVSPTTVRLHADTPPAARIRVVGVGGGGCNAVDRMIREGFRDVDFLAINTDAQALQSNLASTRIQIGARLTRGLGSGGNPLIGQQAAESDLHDIAIHLRGSDMVVLTCGMGGGTGTGAAPIVAGLAQDQGALTVAVVTLPFSFEGNHRSRLALHGLEQLRTVVDTLIIIPNDRLLKQPHVQVPLTQAFQTVDQMLMRGVQGIADLVTQRGLINVDFADVRTIMARAGTAWMAVGHGRGNQRVQDAIQQALQSPLFEQSIHGARGVICNVSGGLDLSLHEVHDAMLTLTRLLHDDANIIFGAIVDQQKIEPTVKVTLVATGFEQPAPTLTRRPPSLPERSRTNEPVRLPLWAQRSKL